MTDQPVGYLVSWTDQGLECTILHRSEADGLRFYVENLYGKSEITNVKCEPLYTRPSQPHIDQEAEAHTGRWVYARIEKLMDAKSGTSEAQELNFLTAIVSQIEEYGPEACADHSLGAAPPFHIDREAMARVIDPRTFEAAEFVAKLRWFAHNWLTISQAAAEDIQSAYDRVDALIALMGQPAPPQPVTDEEVERALRVFCAPEGGAMTDRRNPAKIHNETAQRLFAHMVEACGGNAIELSVLTESLLLGVGMFSFPQDPRRQALIIQEIADGAADRARMVDRNAWRT